MLIIPTYLRQLVDRFKQKNMKHLVFVSAGHSNIPGRDMGAVGIGNIKEGDLTAELRKLVVEEFKKLGVVPVKDKDNTVTSETVATINSILDVNDVAIDIHFNAFHRATANGTEVIVPFKSSEFERILAAKLSAEIAKVLNTTNRGVITEAQSARGTLLFMRPNCENILIEVCFITNQKDLDSYNANKQLVAKTIALVVYDYMTLQ